MAIFLSNSLGSVVNKCVSVVLVTLGPVIRQSLNSPSQLSPALNRLRNLLTLRSKSTIFAYAFGLRQLERGGHLSCVGCSGRDGLFS